MSLSDFSLFTEPARQSADALVEAALAYHSPRHLKALLEFTARLRRYSPYNAMLLHIQNPEATMVATPRDWKLRYNRTIRLDARPLVILAPMHPVLFVFDVRDTEGANMPDAVQMELTDALGADGTLPAGVLSKTETNCARLGVFVDRLPLGTRQAGSIRPVGPDEFRVELNAAHTQVQQYATLAHELAHLFLGHVGESRFGWWKARPGLERASEEFEAEIVSYLVCQRIGIGLGSAKYLSGYLEGPELPKFSLDAALLAAGKIEEMGKRPLRIKKVPL